MLTASHDRIQIVETLRGLMDRLTSPDLTLDEANHLRPQLFGLLATLDGASATDDRGQRRA